jgi:hypothetical protein
MAACLAAHQRKRIGTPVAIVEYIFNKNMLSARTYRTLRDAIAKRPGGRVGVLVWQLRPLRHEPHNTIARRKLRLSSRKTSSVRLPLPNMCV